MCYSWWPSLRTLWQQHMRVEHVQTVGEFGGARWHQLHCVADLC